MMPMTRRAALAAPFAALPARAAEPIALTAATFHPNDLLWARLIQDSFIPAVDARLVGTGHAIRWRTAFDNALFGMRDTLNAVRTGVTDVAWVYGNVETERLPLLHVSLNAPFVTDDLRILLAVMNRLNAEYPPLRDEWTANGTVYLGASGVETYHLFTAFPVRGIADIRGRRIGMPAAIREWMSGTDAVFVGSSLDAYYREFTEGRIEGILSIPNGVLPRRLYEVAPHVTLINLGAVCNAALAINAGRWATLPTPVQSALKAGGAAYSQRLAASLMDGHQSALREMVAAGAGQRVPVTVTTLPDADRLAWIGGMPNIAQAWAERQEARGLPGRAVLRTYMQALRDAGVRPARDWDR